VGKRSGLGMRLAVAGYDLSGDIGALDSVSTPQGTLDVTAIDKSAFERIGALRDGHMEWTSYFNPAANQAHARFSALPTADVISSAFLSTTLGDPVASMVAKQNNYDGTRAADGSFTFKVTSDANAYGLEWGRALTAWQRTDTTGTAGTAVDFATAGSFGLQAYLHVFAFTGTSVTVTIQESSDNGADTYANVVGGAFAAATGVTSERIATAADLAVERYLKVTTSGTFSNAVFAVAVCRNEVSTVF
jgi:hypothetical protein